MTVAQHTTVQMHDIPQQAASTEAGGTVPHPHDHDLLLPDQEHAHDAEQRDPPPRKAVRRAPKRRTSGSARTLNGQIRVVSRIQCNPVCGPSDADRWKASPSTILALGLSCMCLYTTYMVLRLVLTPSSMAPLPSVSDEPAAAAAAAGNASDVPPANQDDSTNSFPDTREFPGIDGTLNFLEKVHRASEPAFWVGKKFL
jgi:hypothetical protein